MFYVIHFKVLRRKYEEVGVTQFIDTFLGRVWGG